MKYRIIALCILSFIVLGNFAIAETATTTDTGTKTDEIMSKIDERNAQIKQLEQEIKIDL